MDFQNSHFSDKCHQTHLTHSLKTDVKYSALFSGQHKKGGFSSHPESRIYECQNYELLICRKFWQKVLRKYSHCVRIMRFRNLNEGFLDASGSLVLPEQHCPVCGCAAVSHVLMGMMKGSVPPSPPPSAS